jgi:hypothetical protein
MNDPAGFAHPPEPLRPGVERGPSGLEMIAIWAAVGLLTLATFVTYARIPVSELYNVSREGVAGGASRTATYLNYPVAFIAIALIAFAFARLYPAIKGQSIPFKMGIGVLAGLALALSLVAGAPGVLNPGDLDARMVNAIPAVGVVLAVVLTILSLRIVGTGKPAPWTRGDRIRLAVTAALAFLSLPWIFANLGFYISDVPLLGALFMAREIPAGHTLAAVHLGDHHGINGVTFFLAGLWLTRELPRIGPAFLRGATAAYLSLMLVYGGFIAAQDFWLEQIVKRGWATVEIPNAVQPGLTPAWGLIVLGTAILAVVMIRLSRTDQAKEASAHREFFDPGAPAGARRREAATP